MLTIYPRDPRMAASMSDQALLEQWRAAWPQAMAVWSRFTVLREPLFCLQKLEAKQEGLTGSFAMIRLADQSVVIDLVSISKLGLRDYAVEILAHEVGHHVLAPATMADQFRLLARIRRSLPTRESFAPMVANLYTDLLINDRLQRQCGLRMADIYRQLGAADGAAASGLWTLYMRMYEHLWKLDAGTLAAPDVLAQGGNMEIDAWLGARLVRVYANDWVFAAGRFGSLLLPYLHGKKVKLGPAALLHDTAGAGRGAMPDGGLEIDSDETAGAIHPAEDPVVSGSSGEQTVVKVASGGGGGGQARDPFEYGDILKAAGIALSDHEIAVRYYRQRALPFLVPFPKRSRPQAPEPQMEGLEPWSLGDSFDEIDWLQTIVASPTPIPGMTTLRRSYGREPAVKSEPLPVDLDMYVDSSGSMPNPQTALSYPALAGAIIALSALRAGASVQVTLWSGKHQFTGTKGFVSSDEQILRVLTGYFGGGTDFPIHRLRDTFAAPRPRPAHILMVSDAGITTMFDQDEQGNSGWDVSAQALAHAGAGGTMALDLHESWESDLWAKAPWVCDLQRARDEQGWHIHRMNGMQDLLGFARDFSQRHYAAPAEHGKR